MFILFNTKKHKKFVCFFCDLYLCHLNIYIYYFILFYIRRAIFTQTNAKKGLIEKKLTIYNCVTNINHVKSLNGAQKS